MPKLDASSFRVRASTTGFITLDFTDIRGRHVEVRFPSAALPRYLEELRKAAQAAPVWRGSVQLDPASLSSTQKDIRLDVSRPKKFDPGSHGGLEFGTSADMSKVLLTIHAPSFQPIDLALSLGTAKEVLANLAQVISIAEVGTDASNDVH